MKRKALFNICFLLEKNCSSLDINSLEIVLHTYKYFQFFFFIAGLYLETHVASSDNRY